MPTLFDVSELVDRVVNYLHDNPQSLCACALVARHWLFSNKYHLFDL